MAQTPSAPLPEWHIGEPDVVFEMPEAIELEAEVTDEYRYVSIETRFEEDRWISASECQPGNEEIVHHIMAMAGIGDESNLDLFQNNIGDYAPGRMGWGLPEGQALLIPAGSSVVFQLHYHKQAGAPAKDRSRIGLRFARTEVRQQRHVGIVFDLAFVLPPRTAAIPVKAELTLTEDIHVHALSPHMHNRGRDISMWARLPDQTRIDLISVIDYDFAWQTIYECERPIALPAGTTIHTSAKFDNSSANLKNTDPSIEVRWGWDTNSEMMVGGFYYTRDAEVLRVFDPLAGDQVAGTR